jgi:hypothetical protein
MARSAVEDILRKYLKKDCGGIVYEYLLPMDQHQSQEIKDAMIKIRQYGDFRIYVNNMHHQQSFTIEPSKYFVNEYKIHGPYHHGYITHIDKSLWDKYLSLKSNTMVFFKEVDGHICRYVRRCKPYHRPEGIKSDWKMQHFWQMDHMFPREGINKWKGPIPDLTFHFARKF